MKKLLHVIGGSLGLAGVVFVALRFHSYADHIELSHFNVTAWLIIALLALVYGAANLLLAFAWWQLLVFIGAKTSWKWAVKAYCQSQLARYMPGNIFHLAGRQALGMAAGLPAGPLVKSAIWELGLIAVAGATFGVLVMSLVWPVFPLWMAFVLFLVIVVTLLATSRYLFSSAVSAALICQIAFLAISGVVFVGTLSVVIPNSTLLNVFPAVCGAYVLAWLAGLVTPGAPAGVGVREMVLLFLLGGVVGQADLLLAVALARIVTVGGDVLIYIVAITSNFCPGEKVIIYD